VRCSDFCVHFPSFCPVSVVRFHHSSHTRISFIPFFMHCPSSLPPLSSSLPPLSSSLPGTVIIPSTTLPQPSHHLVILALITPSPVVRWPIIDSTAGVVGSVHHAALLRSHSHREKLFFPRVFSGGRLFCLPFFRSALCLVRALPGTDRPLLASRILWN
jgi:hypothetical protein